MQFDYYIGIDYSGRGEPNRRTTGIQVVEMDRDGQVKRISLYGSQGRTFSWSRRNVYDYLKNRLSVQKHKMIIGSIIVSLFLLPILNSRVYRIGMSFSATFRHYGIRRKKWLGSAKTGQTLIRIKRNYV